MTPPFILLFALDYTGRDRLTRPAFRAGLVGYWVVAFLFYMTNGVHHLAWTDYRIAPVFGAAAVDFVPRVGLYLFAGSAYVFIGTAAVLILGPLVSYRRLFGRQAAALLVVFVFPTATNVAWLFRLGPTAHLDLTPIMFLITFAAMSYALFREELFELLPATTRVANDIAIDDINAAVLTVSPNGRLIDFNSAAAALFDVDEPTALGRRLDEVLPVEVPLEPADLALADPTGQNRQFDVDVSPIESRTGDLIGYVVTFYDITAERRRQQRLAVQNRVLRHNLRNGLAVVEGYAERIEQVATEDRVTTLVDNIQGTSVDLMQVSEKVRRFDEALSDEPTTVDVGRVCRTVVEDLRRDHPGAEVSFAAEATPHLEGRERLLRGVLAEVVENGIVHDGSETPRVDVRLSTTPDRVTITVEDHGPGIPAAELDALRSGDEDPLSHGSSIGLWIADWGTKVLGGSLAFESGEDGTTVSIRLPRGRTGRDG